MDPAQFDQMVVNLFVNARDAISGVDKITMETATVKQNDGFIVVQIQPRVGTTFKIHLRLHTGRILGKEKRKPATVHRSTGEPIPIVEDQEAILGLVGNIPSSYGHEARSVNNTAEALETSLPTAWKSRSG